MDVIGAGFGRTGTLSIKAALERLGFGPCYHMTEVFSHPEHVPFWADLTEGQSIDWDDLLGAYRATCDFPACIFYQELMEAYPNAKVLLTVRDPEGWYTSARETIYAVSATEDVPAPVSGMRPLIRELIWNRLFDGRFEDREHAIGVFKRWIEEVRDRVPAERLLIFNVREGWEPLCRFLDAPVPDEPFPHLNESAEFKSMLEAARRGESPAPAK